MAVKTLLVYNRTLSNLSIPSSLNGSLSVGKNASKSVDLADVQFDELFFESLGDYNDRDLVDVYLDSEQLDTTEILQLVYGASGSVDLGSISPGGFTTEFTATGVSLVDGTDFSVVESTLLATQGIGTVLSITPTVASGQVTIEVYSDSGRTKKVFEHVVDLSDTATYKSYVTFGFQNDTTGTLYLSFSCSGVAGGNTADISLIANAMEPVQSVSDVSGTLGSGLVNDGQGRPSVALSANSGLSLSGDTLSIVGDITQPSYVVVNSSGAYVTGALDLTTDQSVSGEKRFGSIGYVPQASTGSPIAGTWAVGTEVLDSDNIKWRCVTAGTPGTWELADTVTADTSVVISSSIAADGGSELLEIPVYGNTGTALWLKIWAKHASGTATELEIPFRARVYETTAQNGRDLIWEGVKSVRQTYLTTLLPASQSYMVVNDNSISTIGDPVCVYASDSRYELGRISSRTSGYLWLDEALVDSNSWAVNTLILHVAEFRMVPWVNTDGSPANQQKILLEVRHDGPATDPNLIFYAQAKAMSLGVIR